MPFYRRNLPHLQYNGAEYFVTFRLAGSIPVKLIQELKNYRNQLLRSSPDHYNSELRIKINEFIFKKYESHLDGASTGPHWLKQKKIIQIVQEAIHHRDGKLYDLYAYCLMSNHVHMVFRHLNQSSTTYTSIKGGNYFPVTVILRDLKKFTGRTCNRELHRYGSFWQSESFDRLIRNKNELEVYILYTLNNPVKAGLIRHWKNWPYSYCKPEFIETL